LSKYPTLTFDYQEKTFLQFFKSLFYFVFIYIYLPIFIVVSDSIQVKNMYKAKSLCTTDVYICT